MLGEIYWNNTPATVTRVVQKENDLYVSFEGKISEYGLVQSGRIVLEITTAFQTVRGVTEFNDANGNFNLDYILGGEFEDDSFKTFSGVWREGGEEYDFDISVELEEKAFHPLPKVIEPKKVISIEEPISASHEAVKESWNNLDVEITSDQAIADKLQVFFKEWSNVYLVGASQDPALYIDYESLDVFFQSFDKALEPIREARKNGLMLNVWRAAGLGSKEVLNGQVLKWLLDCHGDHGQGNKILKLFLSLLPEQFQQPKRQTEKEEKDYLRNYYVTAESHYFGGGENCVDIIEENNQVIKKNSRIDIEIDAPELLLFIEIKINAVEGCDQLKRYLDLAKVKSQGRDWAVVYLTKDGKIPEKYQNHEQQENLVGLSWLGVSNRLSLYAEEAQKMDLSNRTAWLVKQFADHIKTF